MASSMLSSRRVAHGCVEARTLSHVRPTVQHSRAPRCPPNDRRSDAALVSCCSGHRERVQSHALSSSSQGSAQVLLPAASAVMLASNKVIHKNCMIPMQQHMMFLVFAQTTFYVAVYGAALLARTLEGRASPDMWRCARRHWLDFVKIGACEALYLVAVFTAVSKLPGALIPVFSQMLLVWNFVLSAAVLRKSFQTAQLGGAVLVATGAVVVAGGGAQFGVPLDLACAGMYCLSLALMAYSSILKEKIFTEAEAELGRPLDVFIVNTFGSLAQLLCAAVAVPVLVATGSMVLNDWPAYFARGTELMLGRSGTAASFFEAWVPAIYLVVNVALNVTVTYSLRVAGSVTTSLFMTAAVPLAVAGFTCIPWPLLGPAPQLGLPFYAGATILMAGVVLYNLPAAQRLGGGSVDAVTA